MGRNREPWYESDNPTRIARGLTWRAGVWIVVAVLFVGAIGGGIWWFNVATSGVKGAGDQTRIVNDGRNRVNAQEWFHSQYAQILAADRQLDEAAANLKANTGKDDESFYRTNYTGLKNRCAEMVANYNAEAQKVSRGQWRDQSLPFEVTDSDTKTDCKESPTPAPAAS